MHCSPIHDLCGSNRDEEWRTISGRSIARAADAPPSALDQRPLGRGWRCSAEHEEDPPVPTTGRVAAQVGGRQRDVPDHTRVGGVVEKSGRSCCGHRAFRSGRSARPHMEVVWDAEISLELLTVAEDLHELDVAQRA